MAANGTIATVWRENETIVARVRLPGGPMGSTQLLASNGDGPPKVAITPGGVAVAIWETTAGAIVDATTRANGTFGPPHTDSTDGASGPDVAVNGAGVLAKAWTQIVGAQDTVRVAVSGLAVHDFPTTDQASDISLAIDDAPSPAVAVAWLDDGTIAGSVGRGGSWQAPPPLGNGVSPTVAIGAGGNATVAWQGAGIEFAAGTTFGSPQTLAGGGGGAPALAGNPADPSGLTAAAWEENGQIHVARRVGSSGFGAVAGPTDLGASDPTISVNPRRTTFLGWLIHGDGARAQAGSTSPVTLAAAGASAPVVASDALGDGVEVFLQGDRVFIFGFDGAPPSIGSVGVPPITPAGSPVGMSAATSDVWVKSPTVTWDFGDGGAATGASTAHTYGSPGIYTVTVRAADAGGNAAAQTRQIAVVFPDRDGDGFPSNLDCNDGDPTIHPGARDIPGDRIDQDCSGKDAPFPRIAATVSLSYVGAGGRRFRVTQLLVKGANRRERVVVRCSGHPKCRFKSKRGPRVRHGRVNLLKKLRHSQRILRTGQTLEVRITRSGFIGKVQRFRFGKRKPSNTTLCLPPGASRPRNRCS